MRPADFDTVLLATAQRQHGVRARWQLLAAGASASLIDDRVRRGRLEHVVRCVYGVPGLGGPRRTMAATVLSFGAHSVASHGSAGALLGIVSNEGPDVAVSVTSGHPRPRDGVRLYRARLGPGEVTVRDGIPVTSPARTLLDLAGRMPLRALEQALARSLRLEIVTCDEVATLLGCYPRRPGSPALRALVMADTPPAMTRSEAEESFLALVRRAGLPEPRVNVRLRGIEADFHWRQQAVVVEIDGRAWHSSAAAQQRDRERDRALAAAGIRVLRFGWTDLTARPDRTLATVALALGRSGA